VAGGAPTVLAEVSGGEQPMALAFVGADRIAFATQPSGNIDVTSIATGPATCDGGVHPFPACTSIVRDANLASGTLVAAPGVLLWSAGTSVQEVHLSSSPNGYSGDERVSTSDDVLTGLAASPTRVYFSDSGVVSSAPFGAYQYRTRLARGQNGARSLVVDDTRVYWSTASCTVESTGL
jgi:hypothetical protein